MEPKQQQPNIALIPSPGLGHLIPFIELAKLLISRFNFTITLLLTSRINDNPSETQSSLLSSLPNAISCVYLPPIDLSHVVTDDLDVVISLILLYSVPSIRGFISTHPGLVAVVTDLFGTPVFDVASKGVRFSDMVDPVVLPGCVPIYGKDFEDALQDRNSEAYNWIFYHLKRYGLVEGILINTFLDLEVGPIRALQTEDPNIPPVYPIRPIVRAGMDMDMGTKVNELVCRRWLDQQPFGSVLFVSFGSGGTLSFDQLNELAIGLERSGVRFMWVCKGPNEESSFGSYYNGHDKDEPFGFLQKGFVDRTKDRGLLISSWAPQIDVLSHKSTGGFLTHCGWNSIMESVVHGVPLIAWPLYAEQNMNSAILNEGLKVALRPEINEHGIVDAERVADVVKELMLGANGRRIQNQMKTLSQYAKRAISDTGDSTKALNNVASKILNGC